MRSGDVEAVVEIEREAFSNPWTAETFYRVATEGRDVRGWVVDAGDGTPPLGYAVYWSVAAEGELANLAVSRKARRRGVARLLLEQVVRTAGEDGVGAVFLEVRASNEAALGLYRTHGFEEVGRRLGYYSRPTEDALILRLAMPQE